MTDTPDFFRRPYQHYPQHGSRFTGEPAYFKHVLAAAQHVMDELGYGPQDFAAAVFHQPNCAFPSRTGKTLGFSPEQLETGMLVSVVGNTYAGSSMLGLTAVLDEARPGDRVLLVSYGSGAGNDAFSLIVTERITGRQERALFTRDYIARRVEIDYATYARYRKKYYVH